MLMIVDVMLSYAPSDEVENHIRVKTTTSIKCFMIIRLVKKVTLFLFAMYVPQAQA